MSGVVNVGEERGDLRSWLTKSFSQNFMKKFFEGALLKNFYKNRDVRDYIGSRGSGVKRKTGFFLRGGVSGSGFAGFRFKFSFGSCLELSPLRVLSCVYVCVCTCVRVYNNSLV